MHIDNATSVTSNRYLCRHLIKFIIVHWVLNMQLQITSGEVGFPPGELDKVDILFYKKNKTGIVLAWHKHKVGVITFYPSLFAIEKDDYLYNSYSYNDSINHYFKGFPKTVKDFCAAILSGQQTLDKIVEVKL